MKELPVNIDVPVTSECWSFYRLAIIEAYPHLRDWKYNHFHNISMTEAYTCFFGTNGVMYNPLTYYEEVLDTKEIRFSSVENDSDIINVLKEAINHNAYSLLLCDRETIYGNTQGDRFVSFLIFGYDDDNRNVHCAILKEGSFVKDMVSYTAIMQSFQIVRNHFMRQKTFPLSSYRFNYPITQIIVRGGIVPKLDIISFYEDLKLQVIASYDNGARRGAYICDGINNYGDLRWDGPVCVHMGLVDLLRRVYNNDEYLNEIYIAYQLNFKMIEEQWRLYVQKIQVFAKAYQIKFNQTFLDECDNALLDTTQCLNLYTKYNMTQEKEILQRAAALLEKGAKQKYKLIKEMKCAIENTEAK